MEAKVLKNATDITSEISPSIQPKGGNESISMELSNDMALAEDQNTLPESSGDAKNNSRKGKYRSKMYFQRSGRFQRAKPPYHQNRWDSVKVNNAKIDFTEDTFGTNPTPEDELADDSFVIEASVTDYHTRRSRRDPYPTIPDKGLAILPRSRALPEKKNRESDSALASVLNDGPYGKLLVLEYLHVVEKNPFIQIFHNTMMTCDLARWFQVFQRTGGIWVCKLFANKELLATTEGETREGLKEATAREGIHKLQQIYYTFKVKKEFWPEKTLSLKDLSLVPNRSEDMEQTNTRFVEAARKLIENFSNTDTSYDLVFSVELSAHQRDLLAHLAQNHNLMTKVHENVSKDKFLVISKQFSLWDEVKKLAASGGANEKYELIPPTPPEPEVEEKEQEIVS
uniref:R3H domain-containing protein n=1 Tax=Timema tahoe TaxID=61484 RepID=A0A7R9FNV9_9NEOP|nr:unnamed protein product [Timema tahoe]